MSNIARLLYYITCVTSSITTRV